LQDGPTAATSAKDGNIVLAAERDVNLAIDVISIACNYEVMRGHPKPEYLVALFGFRPVQ
jgi:hypothetical protein